MLIVAVGSDKDIRENKGSGRPILNERMRLKIIDSLKPVDYSFLSNSPVSGEHWLSPIGEIFKIFKPDAWAINYDAGEIERRKAIADAYKVPLVILELDRNVFPFYGISTTSIIKKVRDWK